MISLAVLLVLSSAAFAGGQGEAAQEESMSLRYGELNPDGHPITEGAYEFARLVEEMSDGRITIEVFPSSQLGSEREQMQSIQQGGLDFFRPNTAAMPDFGVPEMAILGLPYVFGSREHMWEALNGGVGEEILSAVQERGSRMVGLAYLDDGARHIFTTDVPVYEVSDLEGMKIRVPENEVFMDMIDAMGASPTPISYSELYSSLQTGVVDGAENTIAGYLTNSFYEPAPYFTMDRHMSPPGLIVASEILWNRLSESDRELILEAAQQASDFVRRETEAYEAEALGELEELGATIIELDDLSEWQDAVRPLWSKYGADYQDLLDDIAALQ
jgi:TRAP-type transport system periplasmic protein